MGPAVIDRFRGNYLFLSNFAYCEIRSYGFVFHSAEALFQGLKCPSRLDEFAKLNPIDAKRLGRKVQLRDDWLIVKDQIMTDVVRAKFSQNPKFKQLLLDTGNCILIEGNDWNDTYWGVCKGVGQNKLGEILMLARENFRSGSWQ